MLPGGMQVAASCAAVPKQQGRRLHLPCCGRSDGPFFWRGEGIAGDADGSPPHETDDVPHETRAVRAAGDESRGVCRNRRGAGEPHLKIRRIDFVRQQHSEPCRRPHVPEPSPPVSQGAGPNEGSVSGNGRPGGAHAEASPRPAGVGMVNDRSRQQNRRSLRDIMIRNLRASAAGRLRSAGCGPFRIRLRCSCPRGETYPFTSPCGGVPPQAAGRESAMRGAKDRRPHRPENSRPPAPAGPSLSNRVPQAETVAFVRIAGSPGRGGTSRPETEAASGRTAKQILPTVRISSETGPSRSDRRAETDV